MSKSLELALCDTQGKLFELSAKRGYSSESFVKAYMTSDVALHSSSIRDMIYSLPAHWTWLNSISMSFATSEVI